MVSHFTADCRWLRETMQCGLATMCLVFFTTNSFGQNPPAGAAIRLGIGQNGAEPNDFTAQPILSSNGRFIAFSSRATNLLLGMPPTSGGRESNYMQWYVYDRVTALLDRVSVNNQGTPQNGPLETNPNTAVYLTNRADITADGRYVVFDSPATNLVPNDFNNSWDVFLFDRVNRSIELVSKDGAGVQGTADAKSPMFIDYQRERIAYTLPSEPGVGPYYVIKNLQNAQVTVLPTPGRRVNVRSL